MEQVQLPAAATTAAAGRAFLRAFCRRNAVPSGVYDDAALIVSELLTNAFLHARSAAEVCVTWRGGTLHVVVADRSRALPQLGDGSPDATSGRGVLIMDALAVSWGAEPEADGKRVWFELTA